MAFNFKFSQLLFLLTFAFCLASITTIQAQTPQLSKKFAKKVTVEVSDVPIGSFLEGLAEEHKVSIQIDKEALAEDGLSVDDQISLSLKNVTLLTVVKLASESVGFAYLPSSNGIAITTIPKAAEILYVKQYSVPWILKLRDDITSVEEAIYTTTSGPWEVIDQEGGEFAAMSPSTFRVRQNWQNHQEIENLLFQFDSIIRGRGMFQGTPAELNMLKSLQKPTEVESTTSTLDESLKLILGQNEINYWIDRLELANEGLDLKEEVTLSGGKKSIAEHLQEAVTSHGLAMFIDGEVVRVTSSFAAEESMVIRVYDVRAQVRQVRSASGVQDVIQRTVGTGKWQEIDQDGGGIHAVGPLLAITQHRDGHKKIVELLK